MNEKKINIMILVKFIAQSGVLSRRKSEEAIKEKKIKVNGHIIDDPTYEVQENDVVFFNKIKIVTKKFTYILLHKPIGCMTSKFDPNNKPVVMNLLPKHFSHLDPVGRLDFNTSGALLLTDDGTLAYRLSHPRFNIKKTYSIVASRALDSEIVDAVRRGVYLEDGKVSADKLIWNEKSPLNITITLHSGRYRVIRRTLEAFTIFVKKLQRTHFASIDIKGLSVGEWRHLTEREVIELKKLYEKK